MPQIRRIGIEGFRRLSNVDIEMRPLMALIGANGVGKTSFLDALSLLAASARGSLNQHLNDLGGISSVLARDGATGIVLSAEMENPGYQPPKYSLRLVPQGQGYAISEESLTQATFGHPYPFKHIDARYDDIQFSDPETRSLQRPDWEYYPLESALSQVPRMYRESEQLRRTIGSATQYHVLDVGRRAPVKLPQQLRPTELCLVRMARIWFLFYTILRESDHDRNLRQWRMPLKRCVSWISNHSASRQL